jgi:hypothetical protein
MRFFFLVIALLFVFTNKIHGQPERIYKYGNAVYYPIDSLKSKNLSSLSTSFNDNDFLDRYIGIIGNIDSIILYLDSGKKNMAKFYINENFEQEYGKQKIFYKPLKLRNKEIEIKHMKLINIEENFIIVEAKIKYRTPVKLKKTTKVYVPIDSLKGVYLGIGKNTRTVALTTSAVGIIIAVILFGI